MVDLTAWERWGCCSFMPQVRPVAKLKIYSQQAHARRARVYTTCVYPASRVADTDAQSIRMNAQSTHGLILLHSLAEQDGGPLVRIHIDTHICRWHLFSLSPASPVAGIQAHAPAHSPSPAAGTQTLPPSLPLLHHRHTCPRNLCSDSGCRHSDTPYTRTHSEQRAPPLRNSLETEHHQKTGQTAPIRREWRGQTSIPTNPPFMCDRSFLSPYPSAFPHSSLNHLNTSLSIEGNFLHIHPKNKLKEKWGSHLKIFALC